MAFLKNVWYCAALSTEISSTPIRRVICDLPIALFRTASGKVAAVEYRCSHRQASLSRGIVIGEEIQCNYHGFVFDCEGICTIFHISSLSRGQPTLWPLSSSNVGATYGCGGASAPKPILQDPDLPWMADENWRTVYFYFHVKANQQLMADNLLDVSHIRFFASSQYWLEHWRKGTARHPKDRA